ncbi:MAG TPA: beta-galactosidase [Bacteroidales bacterium]|nr:beta-galactosidase [Bacteroidales bacterium]
MRNLIKRIRILLLLPLAGMILTACSSREDSSGWLQKKGPLMTRWSAEVVPGKTWTEYPRPQMQRNNWKSLNGLWDYSITPAEAPLPKNWDGKILVPYPVESALSGVMQKPGVNEKIWYHRTLKITAKLRSRLILLNFEAVDWETEVFIDGEKIGSHKGGYDPFSIDITDHIRAGENHSLVVSVKDPTTGGYQPVGKQTNNPGGIWYTSSSGIWQTVWIEQVPKSYIRSYTAVPDIDKGTVTVKVEGVNLRSSDDLEIRVFNENKKLIGTEKVDAEEEATLSIDNVRLWSPEDPFLYDLEVRIIRRSSVLDQVKGYFGMRKISLGKDEKGITRILLNNKFVFQNGPLDQGFWPDGLNTPPTEEAMAYDLEMIKKMGFNMLRKHVKVEPRRFYYHTDRMGILVWQDMPSMFYRVFDLPAFKDSLEVIKANFETELTELVQEHVNSPSIIMWVPFNEGWGQYDTERIAAYVKTLDPTRLVNHASGWTDMGAGDVMDIHHYPEPAAPPAEEKRAIVLGEFGGLGLMTAGHMWKEENWGYEKMQDVNTLLEKYGNFYLEVARLVENPGLSAVIYTQTTDVETETNGLMTYDRDRVKMGAENVAKAHLFVK